MNKKMLLLALLVFVPASAFAQNNNVGSCGWGSKVMDGRSGIFPQVLAATTNGTSGNQTFGISSGTSGCTQDGVVRSSWKTAMFIDANKTKLARDMAIGNGEALESLAALMGVKEEHKDAFAALARSNFSRIFPSDEVSTDHVMASLRGLMAESNELAVYSTVL